MSAVQIAYGSKNLAQFTCYSRLTCSRITSQDDVHTHLLLFTQSSLSSLNTVLNRISDFTHSIFDLLHANEAVKVGKYAVQ